MKRAVLVAIATVSVAQAAQGDNAQAAAEAEHWREGWELALMLGGAGDTGSPSIAPTTAGQLSGELGTGFALNTHFGYRPIPWVGPWFDLGVAFPSGSATLLSDARGRIFTGGMGLGIYPVHIWRIDPYVLLGSKYVQWNVAGTFMGVDAGATLHGASFSMGFGAPVFVLPWLAVGPALRYDQVFWQSACIAVGSDDNCKETADLPNSSTDTYPNVWSAGLEVVFHPSRPRE